MRNFMMRAPRFAALAFLITVTLSSCSRFEKEPEPEPPLVVTSIPPLAMIAGEICGKPGCAVSILPPGGNPHNFEPLPSDVQRASGAQLLVLIGLGFDDWAAQAVGALQGGQIEVVRVSEGLDLLPLSGEAAEDSTSALPETWDPHFWLDPRMAGTIGHRIADALAQRKPEEAATYLTRASEFEHRMTVLDVELRDRLAPVRDARFITTHAGWAYFANRYGLRQIAVLEVSPGREPGPKTLLDIVDQARFRGVRVVFSEVQLAPGSARVVGEELGIPVVTLDPFGGPGREGRETYTSMLRWNASCIVDALK